MSNDPVGLLLFRLAGRRIAIRLGDVAEVIELPQYWPIPLVPPYFAGAVNSHGALVPLLDLALYMKTGQGASDGKALVLNKELCDLALWVDGVERITESEAAIADQPAEQPFVAQLLNLSGEQVPLFDLARLLDTLEAELQGINHAPISVRPV